jgi:periplasmic divalent cation tolerance protein
MKPVLIFLTCKDKKEADKIIDFLLKKKLIACGKKLSVASSFLWKGKVDRDQEIMIVMESAEENFSKIEKQVKKIHSYNTFVLTAMPVYKISRKAKLWLKNSLKEN